MHGGTPAQRSRGHRWPWPQHQAGGASINRRGVSRVNFRAASPVATPMSKGEGPWRRDRFQLVAASNSGHPCDERRVAQQMAGAAGPSPCAGPGAVLAGAGGLGPMRHTGGRQDRLVRACARERRGERHRRGCRGAAEYLWRQSGAREKRRYGESARDCSLCRSEEGRERGTSIHTRRKGGVDRRSTGAPG